MCPLLWCRLEFNNLAAMLAHFEFCKGFEHAAYWCPDCSDAEYFMPKPHDEDLRQKAAEPKISKVQRAKSFFRHFGIESSTARERAKDCATSVLATSGVILTLGIPIFWILRRRKQRARMNHPGDLDDESRQSEFEQGLMVDSLQALIKIRSPELKSILVELSDSKTFSSHC